MSEEWGYIGDWVQPTFHFHSGLKVLDCLLLHDTCMKIWFLFSEVQFTLAADTLIINSLLLFFVWFNAIDSWLIFFVSGSRKWKGNDQMRDIYERTQF